MFSKEGLKKLWYGDKSLIKDIPTIFTVEEAKDVIDKYIDSTDKANFSQKRFGESVDKDVFDGYIANLKGMPPTMESYSEATAKAAANQEKLNNSFKANGLKTTLGNFAKAFGSAVLNIAAMQLAGVVLAGIVTALDNVINRQEKLIEKGKEAKKVIGEINDDYTSKASYVDENKDTYARLASGVDPTTNKNISLSSDEYAQYLEISNELADLFPQLVSGFDSQGNAMISLSGSAETATSQLEALIEQERQLADFKISQNLPDQFAGSYYYLFADYLRIIRFTVLLESPV